MCQVSAPDPIWYRAERSGGLPTIDLFATTQDRDLGAVARDVQKVIDAVSRFSVAADISSSRLKSSRRFTSSAGMVLSLIRSSLTMHR